jgi:hypothetical protein
MRLLRTRTFYCLEQMPKKFQKGIAETGINDAGYKL